MRLVGTKARPILLKTPWRHCFKIHVPEANVSIYCDKFDWQSERAETRAYALHF